MPLLEVRGVHAAYGSVKALHGVSISVEEGQVVALLGANGAGKTTTLRAISGMVRCAGALRFEGRDVAGRAPEDIARMGIAHVPEGRGTLGEFTVLENLRLGAYARAGARGVAGGLERVFGYFPALAQRRSQQAGTLSGGEQQMLAIGRALMSRPRLLLLDEPSLGLAPFLVRTIFDIVRTINRDDGTSVVLVEQNANIALEISHHAYVLEAGRVALQGSGEELRRDESVRRSYLGY
jgi:branched-chain amino acid transport system ATP-binding protein